MILSKRQIALSLAFLCVLRLQAISAEAPAPALNPPITTGQRVFTTGHSFHAWTAPILDEIAKSAGFADHKIVGVSSIGATQVIDHWLAGDDNGNSPVKTALAAGEVDVLTTSPIFLPDKGMWWFASYGLKYNPSLRVTVQEFWLPNDEYLPVYPYKHKKINHDDATVEGLRKAHESYFHDMDVYVDAINKSKRIRKTAVLIVPAGQAVLALREKVIAGEAPGIKTQNELFADTWGHPTEAIKALATYCEFAVIYRKSPEGLPAPKILKESKIPPENIDALNLLLQKLAWDAVIHHPMSGVMDTPAVAPAG